MTCNPSPHVRPFFRVVADGFTPKGDLKATLIASPEPTTADKGFPFDEWPQRMAALFRAGIAFGPNPAPGPFRIGIEISKVNVAQHPPSAGPGPVVEARIVGHERLKRDTDWAEVTRAWKAEIGCVLPNVWQLLLDDIETSLTGKKHKADPQTCYGEIPAEAPGTFDSDGAIVARRPKPNDVSDVKGVVAIKQGAFALDEERVRAQRVLTKIHRGPSYFDDRPDELQNKADEDRGSPELPADEQKKRYNEERRKQLYTELRDAITITNSDRGSTQSAFQETKKFLACASPAETIDARKFRVDSGNRDVIADAAAVATGAGRAVERSSQVYGTWLQRGYHRELKADKSKPHENETFKDLDCIETREFEKARGAYYSLQGDPLLSRLFCFAVDLEIDQNAVPRGPGSSTYLHLAAEPCTEDRKTVRVLTAAKLTQASRQFWPVSRFELAFAIERADADKAKREAAAKLAATVVEQTNGLWNLGIGQSAEDKAKHAPRYDLISLDVRRAVDANPSAIDRGQRHLTAGFTIIDADRSLQIARDLAIAESQRPEALKQCVSDGCGRRTIILYAEELTIGRRVDVAVGKSGSSVNTLEWRSLMNRYVGFEGLGGTATAILSLLLSARRRGSLFLDEASFQVAARSMPVIDASGSQPDEMRPLEVVAEEAVFLWDGTPAAVLTSSRGRESEKPDRGTLERVQDLPRRDGPDRGACPPPLRFGAPYVFGLRSMFLGGGSPSVEEATAAHVESAGSFMLPPAIDRKVAPQRFLRHEGLSAPTLLLPFHLATAQYGVMGFEMADSAIVRMATAPDDALAILCGLPRDETHDVDGPDYAEPNARAKPERTMRVFVPPMAALDTVARHGMLDGRDALEVMGGGLRDVALRHTPTSFPVAVSERAQALGADKVIYARRFSETSADGAAVFRPVPRRPAKKGDCGYLPDPAAEEYVLRLRIRGTERYLKGCYAVDVYDGETRGAYPNVLPLVVSVERRSSLRATQAKEIVEIISGDPKAIRRIDETGDITRQRGGTRVRYVKITLAPGEDYDLEVACLPRTTTLANRFALPETMAMQIAAAAAAPVGDKGRQALTTLCGTDVCKDIQTEACSDKPVIGFGGCRIPENDAIAAAACGLLDAIKSNWPIEELGSITSLRVCHAINAPLSKPVWGAETYRAEAATGSSKAHDPTVTTQCKGSDCGTRQPSKEVPIVVKRPNAPTRNDFQEAAKHPNERGSATLLLTGTFRLDLEQCDACEIVARTAASGTVIDDPSRSRSLVARRSGRWPRLTVKGGKRQYVSTQDVVGFHVAEDGRVTLPEDTVTLLRVDNLPWSGLDYAKPLVPPIGAVENRLTAIDLGFLHAAAIADAQIKVPIATDADLTDAPNKTARDRVIQTAKPSVLAGTRARKLTLKIVALSRFAESFETTPRYVEKGEPLLHRRQPLRPLDQSRSSDELVVWVPSTERPAKCALRRPIPTFVIERKAEQRGAGVIRHHFERRALTRLYFERGWFSSGEGERVGIVLWPPNYRRQDRLEAGIVDHLDRKMILQDFEDGDLGPGGFFTTRWGGDPIREDAAPQNGPFIPPTAFSDFCSLGQGPHQPAFVDIAMMPVPKNEVAEGQKEEEQSFLPVSLLTYEPCFDLDREEWYVDIDLRPARAADPFVRFGVVRYQPHAICDDLMVSEPATVWAQVLPQRKLELTCSEGNDGSVTVNVELRGQASNAIKPLSLDGAGANSPNDLKEIEAAFARLQTSKLRLQLTHEATDGNILLRTPIDEQAESSMVSPVPVAGQMQWKACLQIPATQRRMFGPGTFVAYVEEFDERMPASYQREPVTPRAMFDASSFRKSGPRFSARVAFLDDKAAMSSEGGTLDDAVGDCAPCVQKNS